MEPLAKNYKEQIDNILNEILNSTELTTYLESEEEEDFQALRDQYEPHISLVYEKVAAKHPLQLISFEEELLKPEFEGLFLPRLLGYAVLRGEVNEHFKYVRPQNHFKEVLMAICNSANFDYLKKRIGQTIQIGFALSSDIWITNLINEIPNKRIRYFLMGQKLKKYRDPKERMYALRKYGNQFKNDRFQTAEFPSSLSELKVLFSSLYIFLKHRVKAKEDNSSLLPHLTDFIKNEDFQNTEEYVSILGLFSCFFGKEDRPIELLKEIITKKRQNDPKFIDRWFDFMLESFASSLEIDDRADRNASEVIDKSIDDDLTRYYNLTDQIHDKGYLHEDVIEAVRVFYNQHEGLSVINECVRNIIFGYFYRILSNLTVEEYHEMFELTKIFPTYMQIFSNQLFNQRLKDACMAYVKKLLKHYTDKRAKDYQDIKKFVSRSFKDFGFLSDKQIVELFKTKRKKKRASS